MLRSGASIRMNDRLLGREIDGVVLGATLLTLLYLVVVIQFPYHIGHPVAMLALHPAYYIIFAGIGGAHKRSDLVAQIRGQTGSVVAIDTKEELPEE